MRRIIILGIALVIVGVLVNRAQADETRRERQCRFQKLDKAIWTPREEWRTARCVTEKWSGVSLSTLNGIFMCESGWNRLAYNSSGPYVGLGQHALSSWPYRVATYEPEWWSLRPRWQNSRTMITVSARMMAQVGLSPWTCA